MGQGSLAGGPAGSDGRGPTVLRRFLMLGVGGGLVLNGLLVGAAYVEWKVSTAAFPPGAIGSAAVAQAITLPLLASVPVLVLAALVVLYATRLTVAPLLDVARTADRIAREGRARVPHLGRTDQIGDLAGALQGWQDAAAIRQIVLERAPIGIYRVDGASRLVSVNFVGHELLGYGPGELEGRDLMELVYPEDLGVARAHRDAVFSGRSDRTTFDGRLRKSDGTPLWCSVTVAPMRLKDGPPDGHVLILRDVSARKLEMEQAAAFQRQLLPRQAPRLADYEVAGACLPAQDVAGDLYDWGLTEDGHLDLTLADVMGKGMGAALVMARLQTALATAPQELSPAARVTVADRALTFTTSSSGGFATLFQARLHPASGTLHYVDAGHGYCVVIRGDGEIARLGGRSLPLGLGLGEVFQEGAVRLEPGDRLLVYSDGLVDLGDQTVDERDVIDELLRAGDAEEMVQRLLGRVSANHADDVTVLVLRRLPAPAVAARGRVSRKASACT